MKIYDKVNWHFPDGKKCPSLEKAKQILATTMKWLNKNNLLSDYGKELHDIGVDSDFSITDQMLTDRGNLLMSNFYDTWLAMLDYQKEPFTNYFDEVITHII